MCLEDHGQIVVRRDVTRRQLHRPLVGSNRVLQSSISVQHGSETSVGIRVGRVDLDGALEGDTCLLPLSSQELSIADVVVRTCSVRTNSSGFSKMRDDAVEIAHLRVEQRDIVV